jgi:hypothetical protein
MQLKNRLAWYGAELQYNPYHASRFWKNVLSFEKRGGFIRSEHPGGVVRTHTVVATAVVSKLVTGGWSVVLNNGSCVMVIFGWSRRLEDA